MSTMPKTIDRETLNKKIDSGDDFVLIEVLGKKEFERNHIKGAINMPLMEIGHMAKERFNPETEIVVYCASAECKTSPKAAKKLENLGFQNVYDYEGGKKDWIEAGLETEKGL
jgi:rhodanese-related sulfurtransferase